MFYVYCGYVSPDNYDASEVPTYIMREFKTAAEVIVFKKEFDDCLHDECSNIIFRVFEGRERNISVKEVAVAYQLE